MSRALVWFRNDLRLHDHPALVAAAASGAEVFPVYCFDARLKTTGAGGHPRCGEHRFHFLAQSVLALKTVLQNQGGDLHITEGNPAHVIAQVARELDATTIYFHEEIGSEEKSDEAMLRSLLKDTAIACLAFKTGDLLEEKQLPGPINQLPAMFTTFRKQVEHHYPFAKPLAIPERISFYKNALSSTFDPTTLFHKNNVHPATAVPFEGGEASGIKRLNEYLFESKNISQYKLTRNGLIGEDYSSKFSLWLANGCLSPRQIAHAVFQYEKEVEANESTYWMIFELLWREYFRWVHRQQGKRIFYKNGIKNTGQYSSLRPSTVRFEDWCAGETGDAFVDANMHELNETGWMSNRGRQNVASFLVHDLGVDWRLGAYYFENKLMDYDVSSNWCNWMYIAGVGNDPRPFRKFNTTKQAHDYDPDGAYRRLWNRRD